MPDRSELYRNGERLGSGGFGAVYKCQHSPTHPVLAKKILEQSDDDSIARFKKEVRILSELRHPNIVKVLDSRLDCTPYFYVMPYYSHSLKDQLQELAESKSEDRIRRIFTAVLDAISYAHAKGVIHRDIKAENVLMHNDASVVVSDFGLGRILNSESVRLTRTGDDYGTVLYLAPEAMSDFKSASIASDIYMLGRLLYEMDTGPLRNFAQDFDKLPIAIRTIVEICTANRIEDRFPTVLDLKEAFEEAFTHRKQVEEQTLIASLSKSIKENSAVDQTSIQTLLQLLQANKSNARLVHNSLMMVSGELISGLMYVDPQATDALLNVFYEFTANEQWDFQYTDKIGAFCNDAFLGSDNPRVKSLMVCLALRVGENHRRFAVLKIFDDLVKLLSTPAEWMTLGSLLRRLPKETVERAYQRVKNHDDKYLRLAFGHVMPEVHEGKADLEVLWVELLDALHKRSIPAYSLVSLHAFPVSFKNQILTIGVPKEFFQKSIEYKTSNLITAWQDIHDGQEIKVKVVVIGETST